MAELRLTSGVTPLDEAQLPEAWQAKRLLDFCSFAQGGRLGLTKQDHYRTTGIPAFSAAGQDGFVDAVEFRNTDAVVLSAIGANCGRCFLASGDWTTLANIQAVIPEVGEADARFLHYRVNRDDYWPRSGSAQPFIKPSDMKSCWVALPPLPQQTLIADVLDTLDTTIRRTEAIVAKLKLVKQGLLHDLLTRGIDAYGELRPPQSQAPHLYKPSPLGWIPREWGVTSIGELADMLVGLAFDSVRFTTSQDGVRLLRGINVSRGFIRWSESITARWPRSDRSITRYLLSEGDVVIGMDGALVGRNVAIVRDEDLPCVLVQRVARLRAQEPISSWLKMNIQHQRFLAHIDGVKTHTAIPHITGGNIFEYTVAQPPSGEIVSGTERIGAIESRIGAEQRELSQLSKLKSGLMDDLLTGRVRVTPLLEAAAAP